MNASGGSAVIYGIKESKTGSFFPGKGTIVGLGIGLSVGIAVDWWMTDSFKEEMIGQVTSYISRLQESMLHGGANEKGIQDELTAFVDDYNTAHRVAIKRAIMETI